MNLRAFLLRHGAQFQFLDKRATHHAVEASQASGIPLQEIVKTIVFLNQNLKPLIAVIRADRSISRHKLQRCSDSKSVRLAPHYIAEAVTGYRIGGIPPVGHKRKVPVFLDKEVLSHEYVWCGGGARSRLVRLKTEDIVRLSSPKVCDLSAG
ncbi:MAG TPA: YbaK/EbsC family protein [Dehalococcoidia bacterium]|nr:YbaK/EbsC family protein [Dehalococcoidia bacterium]